MAGETAEPTDDVYPGYSQAELDRAYTQAVWAPNAETLLQSWKQRGVLCRAAHPGYAERAYGAAAEERIDVFPGPGPVVHFHIHGGAWKAQSKEDCSFIAGAMRKAGIPLVVPDFGLLPAVRMPTVLDQLSRALVWTYETLVAGGRAEGIVISGHSSGAHMAAMLATLRLDRHIPDGVLRAVLCLSGSYDLRPVLLSARRDYIDLDAHEAAALSPILRAADVRLPLHLLYGADDSPEFRRQSRAFAAVLGMTGRLAACIEIAATNHFEIADGLGNPDSPVGRYALDLIGMPYRVADLPDATAPWLKDVPRRGAVHAKGDG